MEPVKLLALFCAIWSLSISYGLEGKSQHLEVQRKHLESTGEDLMAAASSQGKSVRCFKKREKGKGRNKEVEIHRKEERVVSSMGDHHVSTMGFDDKDCTVHTWGKKDFGKGGFKGDEAPNSRGGGFEGSRGRENKKEYERRKGFERRKGYEKSKGYEERGGYRKTYRKPEVKKEREWTSSGKSRDGTLHKQNGIRGNNAKRGKPSAADGGIFSERSGCHRLEPLVTLVLSFLGAYIILR